MPKSLNFDIKKFKSGDKGEFEKIFKTFYQGLCFYAEGILDEKEAAEEIVSDFFLKLWEKREFLQINVSLQSYLYKGVHNNCLKYLEHLKVLKRYKDQVQYMIVNGDLFQAQSKDQPLSLLISKEMIAEIENAINNLPPQCREIFSLARIEELSYQEIAEKLGISINTVRTQIVRAMTKLKGSIGQLRTE